MRDRWRLEHGRLRLTGLPPGTWSVEAVGSDGRSWRGSVTTREGVTGSLVLESTTSGR